MGVNNCLLTIKVSCKSEMIIDPDVEWHFLNFSFLQFLCCANVCNNTMNQILLLLLTDNDHNTELIQTKASTYWSGVIYCLFDVQIFFYCCFVLYLIVLILF